MYKKKQTKKQVLVFTIFISMIEFNKYNVLVT